LQIEHSFPDEVLKHIERLRAVSEKEFEIVIDRLHPRPEFLFLCSRQKPYVISHRDDRSCYQKPAVCVLLEHFFKPHRQGQQGFPGSRPPNQSNNFYLIIKEKFERKFLFLVQRPYPPATRLTIAQMKERSLIVTRKRRLGRILAGFYKHELIGNCVMRVVVELALLVEPVEFQG